VTIAATQGPLTPSHSATTYHMDRIGVRELRQHANGTDVGDEMPGNYDVDASAVLAEMRAEER
jgi:hypothetical protein